MVLTVGAVAARLGVAPETVRSWERRYGLAPGGRSPGGHRRYTEVDCARLVLMQRLVSEGAMAAKAAAAGVSTPAEEVGRRPPALGRAPAQEAGAGGAGGGGTAPGGAVGGRGVRPA